MFATISRVVRGRDSTLEARYDLERKKALSILYAKAPASSAS
jgi:hypothetical protein